MISAMERILFILSSLLLVSAREEEEAKSPRL